MDRRVRVIIGWNYRQRAVNLKYTWEPNYLNWNRLVEVEWPGDRRQRDDHNLVHFSSLPSNKGITSYRTLDNIGMALEVGTLISLTFYLKRMTGSVWHSILWEPLSGRGTEEHHTRAMFQWQTNNQEFRWIEAIRSVAFALLYYARSKKSSGSRLDK